MTITQRALPPLTAAGRADIEEDAPETNAMLPVLVDVGRFVPALHAEAFARQSSWVLPGSISLSGGDSRVA